jgi:hypothetical protein
MITSFGFFMIGGVMALLMRGELARPGLQFLSNEQYNQLFTMHGTVMLLLYATPIVFGFANFVVPLQIGSPDVAFPRLNAFALHRHSQSRHGFSVPGHRYWSAGTVVPRNHTSKNVARSCPLIRPASCSNCGHETRLWR